MTITYKHLQGWDDNGVTERIVLKVDSNGKKLYVPLSEGNMDYVEYLEWKANGGVLGAPEVDSSSESSSSESSSSESSSS
tara:strand:- start:4405 stop:4644 length:240 start_codon:yes stop_codon:yes gene_type:complete